MKYLASNLAVFLVVTGIPNPTERVKYSIGRVRHSCLFPIRSVGHCWINAQQSRSFFKKSGPHIWFIYQLTRPYKKSRYWVEKIASLFDHNALPVRNYRTELHSINAADRVVLEEYEGHVNLGSFCTLTFENLADLESRSLQAGSANLLGFANMHSMFFGLYRGIQNLPVTSTEDIIIRLRPDVVISDIDVEYYVELVASNEIDIVTFCKNGGGQFYGEGRIPDQFFIAKLKTYRKIFSELYHLDAIYRETKACNSSGFGGEVILGAACSRLGLLVRILEGIVAIER